MAAATRHAANQWNSHQQHAAIYWPLAQHSHSHPLSPEGRQGGQLVVCGLVPQIHQDARQAWGVEAEFCKESVSST